MSAVNKMPNKPAIPRQEGIYALILHLRQRQSIVVGRLGIFIFQPGFYVYIGSAFGPGGLAGRLRRHCRLPTATDHFKDHWHIDYLRRQTSLEQIWFAQVGRQQEHVWAEAVRQLTGASIPAAGFGASDCHCRTHLFHFPQMPQATTFGKRLEDTGCRLLIANCSDFASDQSL
jgi:Uri superfamily endonuclease